MQNAKIGVEWQDMLDTVNAVQHKSGHSVMSGFFFLSQNAEIGACGQGAKEFIEGQTVCGREQWTSSAGRVAGWQAGRVVQEQGVIEHGVMSRMIAGAPRHYS